ncbi:MAG: hypothetical protein ACTHJN_17150 [Ginsengibacter sp.]
MKDHLSIPKQPGFLAVFCFPGEMPFLNYLGLLAGRQQMQE